MSKWPRLNTVFEVTLVGEAGAEVRVCELKRADQS
jgi:hypothetical protein